MAVSGRGCGNCGEPLTPRGGLPPRFCPRCGTRLPGTGHPAQRARGQVSEQLNGPAVASVVFGVLGLGCMPLGVPLGALAFFLGLYGHNQSITSGGRIGGKGVAIAGMVLGVLACILWAGVCSAVL
jgi:hypothetical protein